jgi:hypothetical protein
MAAVLWSVARVNRIIGLPDDSPLEDEPQQSDNLSMSLGKYGGLSNAQNARRLS